MPTQAVTPEVLNSTPIPPTELGSSPVPSPKGGVVNGQRQRIRRGRALGSDEDKDDNDAENTTAPSKLPSMLGQLMDNARELAVKEKKAKNKNKKVGKSEFVEGEAAESDDEYGDFGPRLREEDEEDEDEDRHVEGLVDDQAMDKDTENAAQVQAKFMCVSILWALDGC